jgi:hypothetical protein
VPTPSGSRRKTKKSSAAGGRTKLEKSGDFNQQLGTKNAALTELNSSNGMGVRT